MARNQTTFEPGHQGKGGRPPGSRNKATLEGRDLARQLLEDPAYRASLRRRLIAGRAPQMEALLFKYAYGQPIERHEVSADVTAASHAPSKPGFGGPQLTPEGAEHLRM